LCLYKLDKEEDEEGTHHAAVEDEFFSAGNSTTQ